MIRKGFTLIELMIVVAIIGILGAIAIPKFAHIYNCGGNKKNTTACRNYEAKYMQQSPSASLATSVMFKLNDGRTVRCQDNYSEACGMRLYNCEDRAIYQCQTNVIVLPRE